MITYKNIKTIFSMVLLVFVALLSACDDEDDAKSGSTQLYSFGPSVLRGGPLLFIGKNLNQVDAIILPDNIEIPSSEFDTLTSNRIVIEVPDNAIEGKVKLKLSNGEEIETLTSLSILEPITITSIPTTAVKSGSVITIEGTYLNLITEVVFETNKSVTEFEAQSRTSLQVRVPDNAQTGALVLLDDQDTPNSIKTETDLIITLPTVSSLSPETIKAGNNMTINGTDLDLVIAVELSGNQSVDSADFVSQTASQIVIVVPANTNDGSINLVAPSLVKVVSAAPLTMMVPVITDMTPNPAKTDGDITVTGTDLDLISQVMFSGDKEGTIMAGGTTTSITIGIPTDAQSGTVEFRTNANKSVTSDALEMVKPAFTDIPVDSKLAEDIIITGTDLDIVKDVRFSGGVLGTIQSSSETQLTVTVPLGTITGIITLVANNGDEVASTDELTILAEVPEFDSFPASIAPGDLLTLTGTKLNLTKDVIFPGDVTASEYGSRTPTLLEVYVPDDVLLGSGKITFTTYGTDLTESSDINFTGAEPVADANLVFFDFDSKGSWWGNGVVTTDASNSVDGTNFVHITGDLSGYTDQFWRNGGDMHGKDVVGTDIANYEIWFDVKVNSPIEDGNLKMRLQASEGDFWWTWGPAATPSGVGGTIEVSPGWYTMKVPITGFADNFGWGSNHPTDASLITDAFGMAWDNGTETLDVYIDNVRWHYVGP